MTRFIRWASIGFAIFSVIFWTTALMFVELIELLEERLTEASMIDRLAQAAPALLYGVVTIFFCHWFARGVLRRASHREAD